MANAYTGFITERHEGGTEILKLTTPQKTTRLMKAAATGDVNSVNSCLGMFNANPEKQDSLGRTALMYAAIQNQVEVIRTLFQFDVNANAVDFYGHTALMYAIKANATDAASFLIEKTDLDIRDSCGWTALIWASIIADSNEIVSKLIEYGAKRNSADLKLMNQPPLFNTCILSPKHGRMNVEMIIAQIIAKYESDFLWEIINDNCKKSILSPRK